MTASTVKPGDILTTLDQCLALPPGALCADCDGDPILRAAGGWCQTAVFGGGMQCWVKNAAPSTSYLPWRVVALDCSPDLALAEAIRTVLACPDVRVPRISATAAKVLGVARERGETDEQYRARIVAGTRPAAGGLAAAQAALRAVDPEAILSVEDGPPQGLAVRARVSPACDLATAARVLWEHLPVTTETRGEWLVVVRGLDGGAWNVRLDPRPARVGEVVPAMLVPDRAVAEIVNEGTCPRLRWGARGTVIVGPADKSAPREQWGKLCTPIHRQGGWSWPGASGAKTLHRVLVVDVPVSACAAPAEMRRLLGWDEPAPAATPPSAPAQAPVAVGDEVPLARMPIGAVAGVAGSPGEIILRREKLAQYITSPRYSDGTHKIWSDTGGFEFESNTSMNARVLALGVDPQATASAVVDLVADELVRAAGLVRDGDHLRPMRAGDEIPADAAPKGSITRPNGWRDTYTMRRGDGGGWHVFADLSDADSKRLLVGKAGWWIWPSMVPSGRAAVVALDVPDEAWTDRARLAALLDTAAPAAVPAALAVGATVADAAAAAAVPPGTLLMDSGGDAVFRVASDAGDEDPTAWRVLAPECDQDDDTWADADERPDNYPLPWRVVATGLPADLSETDAIERVRAFDLEQLRAAGVDAVAGPDLPPRAVGVARCATARTFVRLADATGWECDVAGDVPTPGGGGWEWDICAPMRVLARDLTDDECIAVTRMDEDAIVTWARTRAGTPAVAAAHAPQVPGVGDEVSVRDLPCGSIGYEAGRERYIARRSDRRYWWFLSEPGDASARNLLLGRAEWHAAPSSQDMRVRIAAIGARDADLCDAAWLRAHLVTPEGCAWAAPAVGSSATPGAVVAAVAAPAPQAGAVLPACEVPPGWLVVQQDIARMWHVAKGQARCVLSLSGWCGLGAMDWRWPTSASEGAVVRADERIRLVAPWPAAGVPDEADYAARVRAWRVLAPQLSPRVAAEMACAIAAGALGPHARAGVAGRAWVLRRVLPLIELEHARLAWHPSGPRAFAPGEAGATVAAARAARDFALMRTSPLHAWAALRVLAGAPAQVREWLVGARTGAAWACGGLTCEVGLADWQINRTGETELGSARDRLSAAAAMIDYLLGLALDAPPAPSGIERAAERSYLWVGASPANADRPCRLGPLIIAPGRAAGFAVGATSADAAGAVMTDVATLTARLARAARVRSLGVAVAAPRAESPDDAAGMARDAVATLDAAGALP